MLNLNGLFISYCHNLYNGPPWLLITATPAIYTG